MTKTERKEIHKERMIAPRIRQLARTRGFTPVTTWRSPVGRPIHGKLYRYRPSKTDNPEYRKGNR